jgi:alpha-1,4-digalacturonate transport system substrate-binding protein
MNPTPIDSAEKAKPRFSRKAAWRTGAVAVGLVSALALAACSGGSGSGSGDSGDSVKELSFWISTSAEQQAGYDALVKDYKAETGVDVKIVNIPNSGMATKMREAAQANSLPDVARATGLDSIWIPKAVDLTSIVEDKAEQINPDLIVKDDSGKVNSIPSDVTAAGLFVNKTLFDKAGVSYPTDPSQAWTWEEFIDAATKVREATGAKYDLTFDASPGRLRAMVYEFGGKYMHQGDDGQFSADDKTSKALEYFASLNDDTIIPKSVWTSGGDPNALFKSGQVVAYFSGIWQVADFSKNITDFDWASATAPVDPVHATDLNVGGNIVAFDNSDARAAAAKKFVSWMYQPKNYTKLVQVNQFLPVEKDLTIDYGFTSDAAKNSFDLYNKEIELADPISSYFTKAGQGWVLGGKTLTTDPSVTQMGQLINGQQDLKTTVDNIVAGYNQQVGGK